MRYSKAVHALSIAAALLMNSAVASGEPVKKPTTLLAYPEGASTPSEACGTCHQAIYREFVSGFGSDMKFNKMALRAADDRPVSLPDSVADTASAHAAAGIDPFPIHARDAEEEGRSCNVCHYPESFNIPDMDVVEVPRPAARPKDREQGGLTCASCHLTPEGKIRGPHQVQAPHDTVQDDRMQTSAMCAHCHSLGKRVPGKQTQTFLEWREDYFKAGLGRQQCQDCHMLKTKRKTAEGYDVPARAVARHLWTGGHSEQRLRSALNLMIVQPKKNSREIELHVANIGAGHSVPTGSNRRAVYLRVRMLNEKGVPVESRAWMFAPWYGARPDDRSYLEEDKKRPDAKAAMQADAQGPHEEIIRAGEERILLWKPEAAAGKYTLEAALIYDLNHYNDPLFQQDQTELAKTSLQVTVSEAK